MKFRLESACRPRSLQRGSQSSYGKLDVGRISIIGDNSQAVSVSGHQSADQIGGGGDRYLQIVSFGGRGEDLIGRRFLIDPCQEFMRLLAKRQGAGVTHSYEPRVVYADYADFWYLFHAVARGWHDRLNAYDASYRVGYCIGFGSGRPLWLPLFRVTFDGCLSIIASKACKSAFDFGALGQSLSRNKPGRPRETSADEKQSEHSILRNCLDRVYRSCRIAVADQIKGDAA